MESILPTANEQIKTRLCTTKGQIASSAVPKKNVNVEQKTNENY
jgi:hypothetical protein